MTQSTQRVLAAAPDVCWGFVGDDLVLFSPRDRRQHVLNSSAAMVWSRLDRPTTIDDIAVRISTEVDATPDEIHADVARAIERFIEADLCVETADVDHRTPQRNLRPNGRTQILDVPAANVIGPLRALGIPLMVEVDDALLRLELARVLRTLHASDLDRAEPIVDVDVQHVAARAYEHGWRILRNGEVVATPATREGAFRAVLAECNAAPIESIDDAVVLHAAGIDLGTGIVVFAGVSNAGKSTLAAQLVERGHSYLTDEAVAIDLVSLQARPFTKALCLEVGSQQLLSHLAPSSSGSTTWDVDPTTIGPGLLSPGGAIRAVVFATYAPNDLPFVRPLEPFVLLRRLLANSFDFSHIGQPAFAALVRAANGLPGYELQHDGGIRHLDQLETIFGGPTSVSL